MNKATEDKEYDEGYSRAWETMGKRPDDFLSHSPNWRMAFNDGADDFQVEKLAQKRTRRAGL